MGDRRRIVTMSAGNRPVVDIDLETPFTGVYLAIRDTFTYAPGASNQQASREPGRYGGQVIVGESNDNGAITWQALVRGNTYDQVAANIETLLQAVNRTAPGRKLEWRADGATFSSFFRIAGPAGWKPSYKWAQWEGAKSMVVELTLPVRPLVDWDPMTIGDDFTVDTQQDYTVDADSPGNTAINGTTGVMTATGGLTTERRWRHTVRGYKHREGQDTIKTTPGATITGYKAGVILRGVDASNYLEVIVDDNGTNSRLRVNIVAGGIRNDGMASTNLGARVSNGTPFWVRGRIEGQTAYAEYWTSLPTPMGTPTASTSWAITAGFQNISPGYSGWVWVPQHASATLDDFEFRPFTYRNQALPQAISPTDAIPGTSPALVNVAISTVPGAFAPTWAMIAWGKAPADAAAPPSIIEAESMTGTWTVSTPQALSRGNADLRATTSGSLSKTASIALTVSDVEVDDFVDGQVDVEVWARVIVTSTLVTPRMAAYAQTVGVADRVYTSEFGSTGKLLTLPSAGTVRRWARLGTVPIGTLLAGAGGVVVGVVTTAGVGSTGDFGLDYVTLALARRRAAGVTGVPAAQIGGFTVPGASEMIKTIQSDLSGFTYDPASGNGGRTAGLGGAMIQPSPGLNRWVIKLSSLVPDDPTVDPSTEVLAHQATVSFDVTPRSYMLRGA